MRSGVVVLMVMIIAILQMKKPTGTSRPTVIIVTDKLAYVKPKCYIAANGGFAMSKGIEAPALMAQGMTQAQVAKVLGISRQAVTDALKRAAVKQQVRTCSECGGELPVDTRSDAATCSGACRAARARRLAHEKKVEALAKINAERAALGYPPQSELM